ncbi:MAG: class D beta-lactamase [Xanthomonadales bacterium]|nr:class D beta-lactamase [Xanthomonadales bacterium]
MKLLFALSIFLLVNQAYAVETEHSPEIEKLFNEAGVNGTFVLYDVTADRFVTHNHQRAEKRFIPASTFKVANSLIGLSTGAISSVDEVLPYGGKPQPFKAWEQDMGLRDAIKVSNVPVYQELARRIGLDRMRENLAAIPYGNADTGNEVDTFWLRGPLQISAMEQATFLARLAQSDLPFSSEIQQSVREIVKIEQADERVLYGKTGWTTTPDPDIGWWVGWVVKDQQIFSFALNIDMPDRVTVAKRIELGKASLKALDIF